MATTEHLLDVVERLTRRWDERDIEGTLAYYTDDVDYQEVGAGRSIQGKDALREYLVSYFKAFDSRWVITSHDRLEGKDAIIANWDMEVWRPGSDRRIMTRGMDILTVRGDQVCSDIVHFDRMQLQPLMGQRTASS